MSPELLDQAQELPAAMSLDSHRQILNVLLDMRDAAEPIDILTLVEKLSKQLRLSSVGGASYIASLTEGAMRLKDISDYVRIIREKSILRRTIQLSEKVRARALDQDDPQAIAAEAQEELSKLTDQSTAATLESLPQYFTRAYPRIDAFYERNAKAQGVQSGFRDLDQMTCGFQPAELALVGARPSLGKTAFAVCLADHAIAHGLSVAFFSLEMPTSALLDRFCCVRANLSMQEVRGGSLSAIGREAYRDALEGLMESRLHVDETPNQTVAQMQVKAQQLQRSAGLQLVIVDYLQLVAAAEIKGQPREQQVAGISKAFKGMAKRLHVPVIVLAQLSRALTGRTDKRPILSDLRESGSLEQDADLVMFLHRPSYYDPDAPKTAAEIIVAKQRQGPLGTAEVFYEAQATRFTDINPAMKSVLF